MKTSSKISFSRVPFRSRYNIFIPGEAIFIYYYHLGGDKAFIYNDSPSLSIMFTPHIGSSRQLIITPEDPCIACKCTDDSRVGEGHRICLMVHCLVEIHTKAQGEAVFVVAVGKHELKASCKN